MPEFPKPVAQAVNLPKASKHHEGTIKPMNPKPRCKKCCEGTIKTIIWGLLACRSLTLGRPKGLKAGCTNAVRVP